VWRDVKLEGSVFNGREPDQSRWNLEVRGLDSYSARLSWNPAPQWSLQVSHGRLGSPEALEPEQSVRRTTASASYQYTVGAYQGQATLAWGRNRKEPGAATDGYLLESALRVGPDTTVFGRLERVQNDELLHGDGIPHGQAYSVGKLSIGAVHDFAQLGMVKFGAGALVSRFWKPNALDQVYGSHPGAWMVFLRAKLAMH
jgi:hypothetical protein